MNEQRFFPADLARALPQNESKFSLASLQDPFESVLTESQSIAEPVFSDVSPSGVKGPSPYTLQDLSLLAAEIDAFKSANGLGNVPLKITTPKSIQTETETETATEKETETETETAITVKSVVPGHPKDLTSSMAAALSPDRFQITDADFNQLWNETTPNESALPAQVSIASVAHSFLNQQEQDDFLKKELEDQVKKDQIQRIVRADAKTLFLATTNDNPNHPDNPNNFSLSGSSDNPGSPSNSSNSDNSGLFDCSSVPPEQPAYSSLPPEGDHLFDASPRAELDASDSIPFSVAIPASARLADVSSAADMGQTLSAPAETLLPESRSATAQTVPTRRPRRSVTRWSIGIAVLTLVIGLIVFGRGTFTNQLLQYSLNQYTNLKIHAENVESNYQQGVTRASDILVHDFWNQPILKIQSASFSSLPYTFWNEQRLDWLVLEGVEFNETLIERPLEIAVARESTRQPDYEATLAALFQPYDESVLRVRLERQLETLSRQVSSFDAETDRVLHQAQAENQLLQDSLAREGSSLPTLGADSNLLSIKQINQRALELRSQLRELKINWRTAETVWKRGENDLFAESNNRLIQRNDNSAASNPVPALVSAQPMLPLETTKAAESPKSTESPKSAKSSELADSTPSSPSLANGDGSVLSGLPVLPGLPESAKLSESEEVSGAIGMGSANNIKSTATEPKTNAAVSASNSSNPDNPEALTAVYAKSLPEPQPQLFNEYLFAPVYETFLTQFYQEASSFSHWLPALRTALTESRQNNGQNNGQTAQKNGVTGTQTPNSAQPVSSDGFAPQTISLKPFATPVEIRHDLAIGQIRIAGQMKFMGELQPFTGIVSNLNCPTESRPTVVDLTFNSRYPSRLRLALIVLPDKKQKVSIEYYRPESPLVTQIGRPNGICLTFFAQKPTYGNADAASNAQKARRTDSVQMEIVDGKISGEYKCVQDNVCCELFLPGICSDTGMAQVQSLGAKINVLELSVQLAGTLLQPQIKRWSNIESLEVGAGQIALAEQNLQHQRNLQTLKTAMEPATSKLNQQISLLRKKIEAGMLVNLVVSDQTVQLCQNRIADTEQTSIEQTPVEQTPVEQTPVEEPNVAPYNSDDESVSPDAPIAPQPPMLPVLEDESSEPTAKPTPKQTPEQTTKPTASAPKAPVTDYFQINDPAVTEKLNTGNPLR